MGETRVCRLPGAGACLRRDSRSVRGRSNDGVLLSDYKTSPDLELKIRKRLLPQPDVGFQGEFGVGGKVFSSSMSPRFGGETTGFESDWLISSGRGDDILVYAVTGVLL